MEQRSYYLLIIMKLRTAKPKYSLVEILIVMAFIVIIVFTFMNFMNGSTTSWGRNLKLETVEGGPVQKWHWTDTNTGERFFSYDAQAGMLYPEQ